MFDPIIILGPTGSGKTSVAAALAKIIDGEIISADSRQVYKYLDIGTNKSGIWNDELKVRPVNGIPQYLTDLIEPSETFSVGDFNKKANVLIDHIQKRGKTPIITGGTGLYVKILVDGMAPLPEKDLAVREELNHILNKQGKEHLYELLKSVDPESAEKNHYNTQRLIRALEVFRLTGTPITVLHKQTVPVSRKYIQFGLKTDRAFLYSNLDKRCSYMLNSGMIEETKKTIELGFNKYSPGLQSLGYRSIIKFIDGEIGQDEVERLMKLDTRHYAKRQLTWFNKDPRIKWLQIDDSQADPYYECADFILSSHLKM